GESGLKRGLEVQWLSGGLKSFLQIVCSGWVRNDASIIERLQIIILLKSLYQVGGENFIIRLIVWSYCGRSVQKLPSLLSGQHFVASRLSSKSETGVFATDSRLVCR